MTVKELKDIFEGCEFCIVPEDGTLLDIIWENDKSEGFESYLREKVKECFPITGWGDFAEQIYICCRIED